LIRIRKWWDREILGPRNRPPHTQPTPCDPRPNPTPRPKRPTRAEGVEGGGTKGSRGECVGWSRGVWEGGRRGGGAARGGEGGEGGKGWRGKGGKRTKGDIRGGKGCREGVRGEELHCCYRGAPTQALSSTNVVIVCPLVKLPISIKQIHLCCRLNSGSLSA
jgi:hypothetical protein